MYYKINVYFSHSFWDIFVIMIIEIYYNIVVYLRSGGENMKDYYITSINLLLQKEDVPVEILGFIYWLLFRLAVNKEV